MFITLIALAAAVSGGPRVITPSERTVIEQAVLPELETPGTLKIGPVPAAATIVCGRVNGTVFKAAIIRNAAGHIVRAQQVSVMTRDRPAMIRAAVSEMCTNQGYNILG